MVLGSCRESIPHLVQWVGGTQNYPKLHAAPAQFWVRISQDVWLKHLAVIKFFTAEKLLTLTFVKDYKQITEINCDEGQTFNIREGNEVSGTPVY